MKKQGPKLKPGSPTSYSGFHYTFFNLSLPLSLSVCVSLTERLKMLKLQSLFPLLPPSPPLPPIWHRLYLTPYQSILIQLKTIIVKDVLGEIQYFNYQNSRSFPIKKKNLQLNIAVCITYKENITMLILLVRNIYCKWPYTFSK